MRSMTGLGRFRSANSAWEVTVELKSVNHRFLDISLRLPRTLMFLEDVIRKGIASRLKRGHVEVFVTVTGLQSGANEVTVDELLAKEYLKAANTISEATGIPMNLSLERLMSFDGVTRMTDVAMDEETVTALCQSALEGALDMMVDMREREGKNLQADLSAHLGEVATLREKVAQRAPGVVEDYRNRLQLRLSQILAEPIEPQRLAQEVAIMADRCAIDEELSRLASHIQQMQRYLTATGEIGKKMDFLIQEMNRETNTIGSKASDTEITQCVVDMKSEIEKLREQIQNVE